MKLPDKLPALADQVCAIEQSRKLWELGVRLESYFVYANIRHNQRQGDSYIYKLADGFRIWAKDDIIISEAKAYSKFEYLPAYTGSELDHLLPFICGCVKLRKGYKMRRPSGSWFDDKPPHLTPAIAKADLLIHLIEEGEVTV